MGSRVPVLFYTAILHLRLNHNNAIKQYNTIMSMQGYNLPCPPIFSISVYPFFGLVRHMYHKPQCRKTAQKYQLTLVKAAKVW